LLEQARQHISQGDFTTARSKLGSAEELQQSFELYVRMIDSEAHQLGIVDSGTRRGGQDQAAGREDVV
jgi:hypothetical protein